MSDKIYNWGILAAGNIAGKFAAELQSLSSGRVYAVGARDLVRAKAFAEEFGAHRYYDSYEELAADPQVDIIYVASPHSHHAEHAQLCMNHGKPVLCEKAFALNSSEVADMVACANRNKVFLMEAFMVPFQPSYLEAKRLIDSGEFGKVKYIQSWFGFNKSPYDLSLRLFNPELGGGALLDIGLYPVFDALYFLGEPNSITAQAELSETGVDQSIIVRFEYSDSVSASLFASFVSAVGVGTDIFCEKGMLRLRRNSSLDQWIEVVVRGSEVKQICFDPVTCGLKNEAIEVMKCLEQNRPESEVMPLSLSATFMKILDKIRQKAGIVYPGRD